MHGVAVFQIGVASSSVSYSGNRRVGEAGNHGNKGDGGSRRSVGREPLDVVRFMNDGLRSWKAPIGGKDMTRCSHVRTFVSRASLGLQLTPNFKVMVPAAA